MTPTDAQMLLWRNLIPADRLRDFIRVCGEEHIEFNTSTGPRAHFAKKRLTSGMHYRLTVWATIEGFARLREEFPNLGRR